MPVIRIGKRSLSTLPEVDKPTIFFDEELKGFGIRCMPSGARTWIVEYRPGAGGRKVAKRRLVIGAAEVLTPEQARRAARDQLAAIRLGADPAVEKASARSASTLNELSARYEEEAGARRKPRTKVLYASYWKLHIRPELGSRQVRDLTRSDMTRLHRTIGEDHPTTANRSIALLSAFFKWAHKEGHIPSGLNPASGIEKFRETGRDRYLTRAELGRLGAAIREAETIGVEWFEEVGSVRKKHAPKRDENRRTMISPHVAAAFRLLLFTGARLREILHLRWSEVDLERGLLLLPDSKTGRKTIVLSGPAVAILAKLPRSGIFVIASDDPERPRSDLKRPWTLVSRRAGLAGLRGLPPLGGPVQI